MRRKKQPSENAATFPASETPVDRMERLALALSEMAEDIRRIATQLREETDAERGAAGSEGDTGAGPE